MSSGAGTIGQMVADVPSGLSLTPPQETTLLTTVNTLPRNGWLELPWYSKVDDNTLPNIADTLIGLSHGQMKKHCWVSRLKKFVSFPFIWREFSNIVCVTACARGEPAGSPSAYEYVLKNHQMIAVWTETWCELINKTQEFLGKPNRLLSFDTTCISYKMTLPRTLLFFQYLLVAAAAFLLTYSLATIGIYRHTD
jgi:hypothetical protein